MVDRTDVRHVAVLTTGRQDYSILRSTIHLLAEAADFHLSVWAGGMHLHHTFGRTIDAIREDGIHVAREIDFMATQPDALADTARAIAGVGEAIVAEKPDALILVGDRTETLAAALAATIERTPIVHLHGGEESEGAIDNVCRHALTKLSHLHLVTHPVHARRVIQMGESPLSVFVVGAPGVDNIYRHDLPTRTELEAYFGRTLVEPVVLVTLHPTTLGDDPLSEATALAAALDRLRGTIVVTQPNSDEGAGVIREFWMRWARHRDNVVVVDALGERRYWALLRIAAVMAGNSSSGIIEAPATGLPVVNIGDRQKGRVRVGMIADVGVDAGDIEAALRRALTGTIEPRSDGEEPYPTGPAAPRILAALRRWSAAPSARKPFYSLDTSTLASVLEAAS